MGKKLSANQKHLEIVILAAGLGTRMKSDLPKVLHSVCGQPMILLLMEQLSVAVSEMSDLVASVRFNVVIGHGRELVRKQIEEAKAQGLFQAEVVYTVQDQQLGTGHAMKLALVNVDSNKNKVDFCAVFNGDLPLYTSDCFVRFVKEHFNAKSVASLGSTTIADAGQYGRVLRTSSGTFLGVVEFKDATAKQLKIREYNGGVYLFDKPLLSEILAKTKNKNASGEFYLPDVFELARKQKKRILAIHFDDPTVLQGVNNMKELAEAQSALYLRTAFRCMEQGVFVHQPETTFIGPRVRFGKGCSVGPFTSIQGNSEFGNSVKVGAHCDLSDFSADDGAIIRHATVAEKSRVGKNCVIGPMAHLRPGTKLLDDVRVGNFVEIKESTIGSHTNAAHLSYIGDAKIGSGVNLGCGFITCNYDGTVKDGRRKHQTIIGNNVFVGSDSQVVAPIEIADGTYIASGSSVTDSVPEKESLVIARTRQVTKPGYARKYKKSH